jgi:hypothetical protein
MLSELRGGSGLLWECLKATRERIGPLSWYEVTREQIRSLHARKAATRELRARDGDGDGGTSED